MSKTGNFSIAMTFFFVCLGSFTNQLAAQQDTIISPQPCKWVPINADTLPDREYFSASRGDYVKPEPRSGYKNPNAVVSMVSSQSTHGRVMDVLIDCDEGQDTNTELMACFDFSCEGNFNGLARLPIIDKPGDRKSYNLDHTIIDAVIEGEARKVDIKLQYWRNSGTSRYLWCVIGTALEGRITLGDTEYIIQFCDGNGNLQCKDKSTERQKYRHSNLADMVRLLDINNPDQQRPLALGLYGEPMVINGRVYSFTLDSENRAVATLKKMPMAKLKMPYEYWRISLVNNSESQVYYIQGKKGTIDLPAGDYTMYGFVCFKEVDGVIYSLVTNPSEQLIISEGQILQPDLSKYFELKVNCKLSGRSLRAQTEMSHIKGIWYGGKKSGAAPEPVIECVGADGEVFASYQTKQYSRTPHLLPPNFPYQFKVRLIWPEVPFEFISIPVEIDVDEGVNTVQPSL